MAIEQSISDNDNARHPHVADRRRQIGLRLALLSGILMWISCPPLALWPLAWVALAPLGISVLRARNVRSAMWRGYLFGWIYFGGVCYWVGLTIVGWTGSKIGWLALFGLTFILAGWYGLWAGLAHAAARRLRGGAQIAAMAALWVVMEWARTLGALTMPWAQVSYTQFRFLPILQIADVTGAYGVSFIVVLVNFALASWWMHRRHLWARRQAALVAGLAVVVAGIGLWRMRGAETGPTLTVADMQANFSVRETEDDIPRDLASLVRMTADVMKSPVRPGLIVYSESAAPGDALYYPPTRHTLESLANDSRVPVMTGAHIDDPLTHAETNSSLMFFPDVSKPLRYDKQQLVPFGEFIPYRNLIPAGIQSSFQFFKYDVLAGHDSVPFRMYDPIAGNVAVGPFICYESMYPHYTSAMVRAGANLLVTQSNDAWFQSSAAMEQHLAAVVLRAVENRRDVVRSTTSGVTCIIDSRGAVVQRATERKPTFLIGKVHLLSDESLYTRFGDWFVTLCALIVPVLLIAQRRIAAHQSTPEVVSA